ncbi:MAG: ABC transporter permease [Chloroflexi bacterium]|nr:ABC transporter permease [Chloroflexota bacterium]
MAQAASLPESTAGVPVVPAGRADSTRLRGFRIFMRRLLKVRGAGLGLGVLLLLVAMALTAPLISPQDPVRQDLLATLDAPSAKHLFGTDDLGRDVLSRVIYGSRVSLIVGLISIGVALFGGVLVGLTAGYVGGLVDDILMRVMDAISAFPSLVLALAITAALGAGIENAMIAIGIVYTPLFARLIRSQALTIRELDYCLAARTLGAGPLRMMFRHIWPNATAPIIVQASLSVSSAIIVEASLSFLGVGILPPTPSWGSILNDGYKVLQLAPWMAIAAGGAIFVTVLGLNFLGDGLRTALDPRMSRRGD